MPHPDPPRVKALIACQAARLPSSPALSCCGVRRLGRATTHAFSQPGRFMAAWRDRHDVFCSFSLLLSHRKRTSSRLQGGDLRNALNADKDGKFSWYNRGKSIAVSRKVQPVNEYRPHLTAARLLQTAVHISDAGAPLKIDLAERWLLLPSLRSCSPKLEIPCVAGGHGPGTGLPARQQGYPPGPQVQECAAHTGRRGQDWRRWHGASSRYSLSSGAHASQNLRAHSLLPLALHAQLALQAPPATTLCLLCDKRAHCWFSRPRS